MAKTSRSTDQALSDLVAVCVNALPSWRRKRSPEVGSELKANEEATQSVIDGLKAEEITQRDY